MAKIRLSELQKRMLKLLDREGALSTCSGMLPLEPTRDK